MLGVGVGCKGWMRRHQAGQTLFPPGPHVHACGVLDLPALCLPAPFPPAQNFPAVQGFQKTGLGQRVATIFVKYFGEGQGLGWPGLVVPAGGARPGDREPCLHAAARRPNTPTPHRPPPPPPSARAKRFPLSAGKSTLGLSYGLTAAETLIAPAMPSTTARAGGIFMPIISSLSQEAGSLPSTRVAGFLWRCGFPLPAPRGSAAGRQSSCHVTGSHGRVSTLPPGPHRTPHPAIPPPRTAPHAQTTLPGATWAAT